MKKVKEKPNKKNLSKTDISSRFRTINILVIIVALAGFSYLGYFLYQKVYLTIIQAAEVEVLKQKVALEVLDTKTFEGVLEILEKEKMAEEKSIEGLDDPFR